MSRAEDAAREVREKIQHAQITVAQMIAARDAAVDRMNALDLARTHPTGAKAWRQTQSGAQWFPLDPRPGDFAIEDIAHGLANLCRYGGQACRFYSVAEHSVICSLFGDPRFALRRLLHDAAEAVLGIDFAGPLKRHPLCRDFFKALEEPIERAVFEQFGCLEPGDWHEIDMRIFSDERAELFGPAPADWFPKGYEPEPLGALILGMRPDVAKDVFLHRFRELAPEYAGP